MPDMDHNQIESERRGRSVAKGDIPERVRRRYFIDGHGGPGLGFYVDARVRTAAFRDLGIRLVTGQADPNTIRDMAKVAQHRGWTAVTVHGEPEFRREAWLTVMSLGIETRGYRPSARDRQELERRTARTRHAPERDQVAANSALRGEAAPFKVVEAVVRTRVQDRAAQDRVLQNARHRIAAWLEQGARVQTLNVACSERQSSRQEPTRDR